MKFNATEITILFVVFTLVCLHTVSTAPLSQRAKRHAPKSIRVDFAKDAPEDKIEEIEESVEKLNRSRRSAAFFLQATLHYCAKIPSLCSSIGVQTNDGTSATITISDM